MVLTYSGLRHLALCLQTKVLFPWLREPVLFAPDTRHRSPVRMTSWTMLRYSHMCSWKFSGITFNWLMYCSGLNFSKWSQQLCICKYLICVIYFCHYLWRMCVYSKCVTKWSMQRTCDNSVTWYWPSLGSGTLHCVVCGFTGRESQCSAMYCLASRNVWLWRND